MTTFVRGAQGVEDTGEDAPGHRFDDSLRDQDPVAEVAQTFDSDQTYRYAEASGDPMQIHLDEEFAKSVGLPGIIIHGMNGSMVIPAVALALLLVSFFTRVRGAAMRAAIVLGVVALQITLGFAAHGFAFLAILPSNT